MRLLIRLTRKGHYPLSEEDVVECFDLLETLTLGGVPRVGLVVVSKGGQVRRVLGHSISIWRNVTPQEQNLEDIESLEEGDVHKNRGL